MEDDLKKNGKKMEDDLKKKDSGETCLNASMHKNSNDERGITPPCTGQVIHIVANVSSELISFPIFNTSSAVGPLFQRCLS